MSDFAASDAGAATGPRASFGTRFVAALIDVILIGVVGGVSRAIFTFALAQLVSTLAGLAYYTYLEGSPSGQTLGKRAMNIRVVDIATGESIGTTRALIRYVGRIISAIPCGLGYFWMLWDNEKQTWHDKLATSVVVPTSAFPVDAWPG
jgi:uncharacterized RDD family membrane protein YckC